ncbi:aspartate kinase [Nicoliella lavandulae]|uniref:Aspartokinase n=1 Tax=Nicoliella lavandulae TaxID=3082954 RepID=A0ABU8SMF6_9LACO
MIVAKFGGSSMADADQLKKVKAILNSDSNRQVAVVSAAGKGIHNPVKLTDQLIHIYDLIQAGKDFSNALNEVWQRLDAVVEALDLDFPIHEELSNISKQINQLSYAELVSRGEYLTAHLLASYLKWPMIDAADFLVINSGQIDYQASKQRLMNITKHIEHCVIPGFYGVNAAGKIELLPRGGGDTSGAVVSNLVNAACYENWTDTNGILAVDPRIVDQPTKVNILSYDELQELSYLGVKVFNEEAVQPVRMKQIPIRIMNTNRPELGGTFVVTDKNSVDYKPEVAGIAGKQDQVILTVKQYQLSSHVDSVIALIRLVNNFHLKSTYSLSGDSISFVLSGVDEQKDIQDLVNQINANVNPDNIHVTERIAKVAVVSEAFCNRPRLVGKMIELLEANSIPVQQVIQTSDDIKVVFGVANADYQRAIECLYHEFFRKANVRSMVAVNS